MTKFIKFGFVGIVNTAITIGSYAFFIYIAGMNYILANIIAYVLGMVNSFIWNKKWVFQIKESHFTVYVKFLAVNILMLGINSLGLFILVNILHFHKLVSQFAVVGVGMVLNFFLTSTWAFAQKKYSSADK
ncbi:GtrA family protein [Bacillus salipaludis]|uniref:GtrA family protein n=1 Tax=Bacillus salipaludis TaxID=2547811 RepID=A0ABW8R9W6_9BACI